MCLEPPLASALIHQKYDFYADVVRIDVSLISRANAGCFSKNTCKCP